MIAVGDQSAVVEVATLVLFSFVFPADELSLLITIFGLLHEFHFGNEAQLIGRVQTVLFDIQSLSLGVIEALLRRVVIHESVNERLVRANWHDAGPAVVAADHNGWIGLLMRPAEAFLCIVIGILDLHGLIAVERHCRLVDGSEWNVFDVFVSSVELAFVDEERESWPFDFLGLVHELDRMIVVPLAIALLCGPEETLVFCPVVVVIGVADRFVLNFLSVTDAEEDAAGLESLFASFIVVWNDFPLFSFLRLFLFILFLRVVIFHIKFVRFSEEVTQML